MAQRSVRHVVDTRRCEAKQTVAETGNGERIWIVVVDAAG